MPAVMLCELGVVCSTLARSGTRVVGQHGLRLRQSHCVQISRGLKRHISTMANSPGYKLALCTRAPEAFRANLHAHVATMGPLGFNAHALGVLASRNLSPLPGHAAGASGSLQHAAGGVRPRR